MTKRMLDTNAVRALVNGYLPRLDSWFTEQRCYISAIVAAEIRFGLEKNALNAGSGNWSNQRWLALRFCPGPRPAPLFLVAFGQ
jgi:predicted nucleic acid-binding protein